MTDLGLYITSILYYATKANKGNAAISEFRFGMVLVGWLTKYVLMSVTRSIALASAFRKSWKSIPSISA